MLLQDQLPITVSIIIITIESTHGQSNFILSNGYCVNSA